MSLSASVLARISATFTASNAVGAQTFTPKVEKTIALDDGTGANQADLIYAAERTVGDGSNDDIDLAGVLTDAFGATITNAEMVAIMIVNQQADGTVNTTDLTVGGATNAFEGFLSAAGTIGPIKPGGMVCIAAGDAAGIGTVTAGTDDELRVANSAGAANTYQIIAIGRTA